MNIVNHRNQRPAPHAGYAVFREFDYGPFIRSIIGLDRLGNPLDSQERRDINYPPHNVEKLDDETYLLTLAVAGFDRSDIEIVVQGETMEVSGRINRNEGQAEGRNYLYHGISSRPFNKKFMFVDSINVESAEMTNGLLKITLRRLIPEAMKPRRIQIGSAQDSGLKAIAGDGVVNEKE